MEINTVPTVVAIIISPYVSAFIWYAHMGKMKASETHVNKPSILNMATNLLLGSS